MVVHCNDDLLADVLDPEWLRGKGPYHSDHEDRCGLGGLPGGGLRGLPSVRVVTYHLRPIISLGGVAQVWYLQLKYDENCSTQPSQ
jgi:hypothetical protein